jgi:serine/threonine protein kinase
MVLGDSEGVSESDWGRLEERIAAFEDVWNRGGKPTISDYLPDDEPHRQALLIELVHTEFEFRLKNGESARVEEYLRNYPSLSTSRSTVLDLIRAEWSFRKRREPALTLGQLGDRFPEFRNELDTPNLDPPSDPTPTPPFLQGLKPFEPTDQTLPRRFGKYQLRQKIGSGTFGVVYRAWDLVLNREVAVKIPRPEVISEHQNVRAFLREARTAIDLRHPNIVAIHDAGPIEGIVCIIRAYVEGTTLAEQIRGVPLAPEESAAVIVLVADALDYAHGKGIIHRDLKPSNILLDLHGQPHITDFGLAKRSSSDSTLSNPNNLGGMIGTPAYMSPEQARGESQKVDPRSDVFSTGVVLYELLTGSVPFRGRGRLLLAQIQELEPTPPRLLNEELTEDLDSICLKALAKAPEDRYQSAREMADDLRIYLRGRSIPSRTEPHRRNTFNHIRLRSIPLVIPTALLALLVVVSVLWLRAAHRQKTSVELTGRNYRALLDLARPAETPGLEEVERIKPLAGRIWSELETQVPLIETEPDLLTLAAEARRRLAERAGARGSDRAAEVHWKKAVILGERLVKLDPNSIADREGLALALARLAAIRQRSDQQAIARSLFERSLALRQENLEALRRELTLKPNDLDRQIDLGEALLRIGEIDQELGKPLKISEIEPLSIGIEGQASLDPSSLARLAVLELELAGMQLSAKWPLTSITSTDRAQRLFEELTDGPIARIGIARSFLFKARSTQELERLAEARNLYRQTIERLETIDREDLDLRRLLGITHFEYGRLLDRTGSHSEALLPYRKALEIREWMVSQTPDAPLNLAERAETRSALGLDLMAIGDRLQVLTLAPGMTENRRELRRLTAIHLAKVRRLILEPIGWLKNRP